MASRGHSEYLLKPGRRPPYAQVMAMASMYEVPATVLVCRTVRYPAKEMGVEMMPVRLCCTNRAGRARHRLFPVSHTEK